MQATSIWTATTWTRMKTLSEPQLIVPDWPAPPNVRALQTTRQGGVSESPYRSLNLGDHVGDEPMRVAANRQRLNAWLPTEPVWLQQVHGRAVVHAEQASCLPQADAAVASSANAVCAVMTADCLPLLICDSAGSQVAAVHAGWRGLQAGVIEAAVAKIQASPADLLVWLGPAIGPQAFEVGAEVREAFTQADAEASTAFVQTSEHKWLADIYLLARQRLERIGVTAVYGGDLCTYTDSARFFSYRRDGVTGRMASMIWIAGE
jgi:YfiH family protein